MPDDALTPQPQGARPAVSRPETPSSRSDPRIQPRPHYQGDMVSLDGTPQHPICLRTGDGDRIVSIEYARRLLGELTEALALIERHAAAAGRKRGAR